MQCNAVLEIYSGPTHPAQDYFIRFEQKLCFVAFKEIYVVVRLCAAGGREE